VRLLTRNGPQAIDQQTAKLRSILTGNRDDKRASGKHQSSKPRPSTPPTAQRWSAKETDQWRAHTARQITGASFPQEIQAPESRVRFQVTSVQGR
jgi:hypothetical protein